MKPIYNPFHLFKSIRIYSSKRNADKVGMCVCVQVSHGAIADHYQQPIRYYQEIYIYALLILSQYRDRVESMAL